MVDAIRSSHLSLILITHGTDTIIETAKYLQSQLDGYSIDKCVLLTGELSLVELTEVPSTHQNFTTDHEEPVRRGVLLKSL